MPARTPKPRLQSGLFTGNAPDAQQKLDACLSSDGAHIHEGHSGRHVEIIQIALGQVRDLIDARIPAITDPRGRFGASTRSAVRVYKETRDIVRPGQPLDDIVGRSTISFLDDDIVEAERGSRPPPPPVALPRKDIVVQIVGFGGPNSSAQGAQLGSGVLRASVISAAYTSKPNRSLETIMFTGGQNPNPVQRIAALVRGAILGGSLPGLICLTGESAGGKNVLELARELVSPPVPLPLAFLGLSDAAFFDADAAAAPNSDGNNLLIRANGAVAGERRNIFQSAGNGTEFSIGLGRTIWSGKMSNKEVHGKVEGFFNRDLTEEGVVVFAGPNTNFESLHSEAASIANQAHLARIRALLAAA